MSARLIAQYWLFSEGFQLVLPVQHPLAGQNRLMLEDLRAHRVFARPPCGPPSTDCLPRFAASNFPASAEDP
jgi:hypothetical protein